MCGIVGYITTETNKDARSRYKYITQAIIADTMRGDDSTGAFFVPHESEVGASPAYCKSTSPGYDFVTYDKNWHEMSGDGSEFFSVFGHNRAATVGKIGPDTAHPFRRGPITLVHNGTLRGTHTFDQPQHQGGFYNDSDTLAANLARTTIDELSPKINGAYALAWHDTRDNSTNILRNDERPLHLCKVKGQDTIFVASEALMLQWLLTRLSLKIETMVYPKPMQWLKFEHGSLVPTITELEEYTYSYPTGTQYGHGASYGYAQSGWEDYYAEEEDWDPVGPAHPKMEPPKPAPTMASVGMDSRVFLGGRKQEVPARAQELLLDVDLLVEDREVFEPLSWAKGTSLNTLAVLGYLPETGMAAIAYNVPKTFVEGNAIERNWVVQPVTVKMNDEKEPVIVCKVKHVDANSPAAKAMLSPFKTGAPASTEADTKPEEEAEDQVPFDYDQAELITISNGDGATMPLTTYLHRTGSGCINCAGNIYVGDADDVVWVNQGQDPMCPMCVDEMYGTLNEEQKDAS